MTDPVRRWDKAAKTLVVSVLLLNVLGFIYNLRSTAYIRHDSMSVTTDVLLRLLYFGFMAGIAVSEVLLVDQLAFRGAWRKRVLGGLRGRAAQTLLGDEKESAGKDADEIHSSDDDAGEEDVRLGAVAAIFRDYTAHVSILFLVFLGLNYLLFNWANGGFDSYYRQVGMLYTELRSSGEGHRIAAIGELASKRRSGVSLRLLDRVEKGTDKERTWAAWALGYRAAYGLLPGELRSRAEHAILPLVASGDMSRRGIAAVSLARLQSYLWLGPAVLALSQEQPDPQFAIALGLLEDNRPESMAALAHVLSLVTKGRLAQTTAWALGQIRTAQSARVLDRVLFKLDPLGRCIAVESLGRLGRRETLPTLIRFFESKSSDVRCPQIAVKLRPDREGDRLYLYYWGSRAYRPLGCVNRREPLRVRILKVLWRVGDKDVLPWVRSVAESDDYSRAVKDCAVRVYNASVD